MMKILFLVQGEQRVILDRLYEGVAAHTDCDLRWLSDQEQANLKRYFHENVNLESYERIILFLRSKKMFRQPWFIRTLPNLVLLEHDAYQNFSPSKYQGKFSAYYRRLPAARVISSGFQVTEKLRAEGVDAVFVPKGYDQILLRNLGGKRDIELGFVGSMRADAYQGRRALLEAIKAREADFTAVRTESGSDYCRTLNRIRFFISPDAGMGEYMLKNFEAMACGCVLCAFDQGKAENDALGFKDMENLVLFREADELQEKLRHLRAHSALADAIAAAGQDWVERHYSFERLGQRIAEALQPPLRTNPPPGFWERLRLRLGV